MSFTPADLVLLRAMKQGIAAIRANPWVLDFIFERLIEDEMDLQTLYGEKEINRAKSWFLKNNIDVRLAYNLDGIQFPSITIELLTQNEAKEYAVLGDVAAPVWDEDVDQSEYVIKPRALVGPFPSVNYNLTTGEVTLPKGFDTGLIFQNQALFAPLSKQEYIITSLNKNTTNSFFIQPHVRDNFTDSYISPAYKTLKVRREIAQFHETYNFKIMVQGDAGFLIWLHTIVAYLLLKFRKTLLEQKNITVSTISSGPLQQEDTNQYGGEIIYSRIISMESISEVTWVSDLLEKFEGSLVNLIPNSNIKT